MEKVNYYSRITKRCIEKTKSDLDYQRVFPDIYSPANIWNMSDDESYEEESLSNDCILYSENVCFSYLACGMKGRNISIMIIL